MKCDQCDNEATVHEVTVHKGVKIEKHLCEQCAQQHGLANQQPMALNEMMSKFTVSQQQVGQPRMPTCPTCKMTFPEFRQGGLLGCPDCYRAFEGLLAPLIERAHEGAAKHTGKGPRRMLGPRVPQKEPEQSSQMSALRERAERLKLIRRELDQAVKSEEYERAAKLRDELKKMDDKGGEGKK